MDLLWSNRDERQARASLNNALVSIRRLDHGEGLPHLASDGQQVTLRGAALETDVARFQALQTDEPAEAAKLYNGPLLDGLEYLDPAFDDWLTAIRSELHTNVCDALQRAADRAAANDDTKEAIDAARRLVTLDPLRESGHRLLMRMLHVSGDRVGALRQYQACAQILKQDLQVEPAGATKALFEEIRRDAAPEEWTDVRLAVPVDPLPLDKPSIAVLPFDNLSDDAGQDYFADGVCEDIITALARFPSLFVIARNSSFTYKGRPVDVKLIGRELGVRYVLEGSVRKIGNRVRVTGQLVQADNGVHVWAERYDRDLTDIFALQDEMAASVVGAVVPSLQIAEIDRARRRPPNSHDAYDLYLRALPEFYAQTQESTRRALKLVEQALALDPNFVAALILGENCWSFLAMQGWISTSTAHPEIMTYAYRAVQVDNNDAEAVATLARRLCAIERDYDGAISAAERAVMLNPNSAVAWRQSGFAFLYSGRPERALEHFRQTRRLSPRDPRAEDCWTGMSQAFMQLEQDSEAVAAGRKAVQANPNSTSAWRVFTAALALEGQLPEACAAMQRLLAIDPGCSLSAMLKRIAYTETARARYFTGLRQAGLPE